MQYNSECADCRRERAARQAMERYSDKLPQWRRGFPTKTGWYVVAPATPFVRSASLQYEITWLNDAQMLAWAKDIPRYKGAKFLRFSD
jgi:hypothetical protein